MSQQEEKPITKEVSSENAVNDDRSYTPEPIKEVASGSKKAAPKAEPASTKPRLKPFHCTCRDCRLYFGNGNPIECVNPNIVEMRYPKWKFANNSGTNKVPVFRRPADPDSRKDHPMVKRAKR